MSKMASQESRDEYARQARARIDALPPRERAALDQWWERGREAMRLEREYSEWVRSFPDFARPW